MARPPRGRSPSDEGGDDVTGNWPRPVVGVLCAGLGLAMAGCGGSEGTGSASSPGASASAKAGGDGPVKLLFVTNSNADWWNAVEKGMIDGGKEFGAQVEMRRNDGQVQGQIRLLQDALS